MARKEGEPFMVLASRATGTVERMGRELGGVGSVTPERRRCNPDSGCRLVTGELAVQGRWGLGGYQSW